MNYFSKTRLLLVALFLKIIDLSTTYYWLAYHSGTEANPFVKKTIDSFGLENAMILNGLWYAIVCFSVWNTKDSKVYFVAIGLLMSVVAINNFLVIWSGS